MTVNLSDLRNAANEACRRAYEVRDAFDHAAVNWADFACTSAQKWEDDSGNSGYRVVIEEADPSNREVGSIIAHELLRAGFIDVEVCFEW